MVEPGTRECFGSYSAQFELRAPTGQGAKAQDALRRDKPVMRLQPFPFLAADHKFTGTEEKVTMSPGSRTLHSTSRQITNMLRVVGKTPTMWRFSSCPVESGWSKKTEKFSQWTCGEFHCRFSAESTWLGNIWKIDLHGTINGWCWRAEWSSVAYNSAIKDYSSVSSTILRQKAKIINCGDFSLWAERS